MHGTLVTVTAAYPQSTLNGTPTDSSLNSTASYETHLAGRRNLDVIFGSIYKVKEMGISMII